MLRTSFLLGELIRNGAKPTRVGLRKSIQKNAQQVNNPLIFNYLPPPYSTLLLTSGTKRIRMMVSKSLMGSNRARGSNQGVAESVYLHIAYALAKNWVWIGAGERYHNASTLAKTCKHFLKNSDGQTCGIAADKGTLCSDSLPFKRLCLHVNSILLRLAGFFYKFRLKNRKACLRGGIDNCQSFGLSDGTQSLVSANEVVNPSSFLCR